MRAEASPRRFLGATFACFALLAAALPQAHSQGESEEGRLDLLSAKADQLLVSIRQKCAELHLLFLGPSHFVPESAEHFDANDGGSIAGPTVRIDSHHYSFTFTDTGDRLLEMSSRRSELFPGGEIYSDPPDKPTLTEQQAIALAEEFRTILPVPPEVKLASPHARFNHSSRQGKEAGRGAWIVDWPRVDSSGHPFHSDFVSISFYEGHGPAYLGLRVTTPFNEVTASPLAMSSAQSRAQRVADSYMPIKAFNLFPLTLTQDEMDITEERIMSHQLMIVVPHVRAWWEWLTNSNPGYARLAWVFWFKPIHSQRSPGYDDDFSVWIDAHSGEPIGGDAVL